MCLKLKVINYIVNQHTYDNLGGDVKFDVWFEHYIVLKSLAIKKRSINQIRLAYQKHIQPIIGDKRMFEINMNDVSFIYRELCSKNYSGHTIKTNVSHLRAILRFAKEEGILKQVPVVPIKITNKQKTAQRFNQRRDYIDIK